MRYCVFYRVGGGIALGLLAILAAGCDSVIHKEANIGGVDTLSIDAKQRLMVVGNRISNDGAAQERVACTEPSPDALVAKAAAFAAQANVDIPGSGSGGGAGGGGFSEAAASIAFRDHTVQMLRDGYYRLCEAYLNGGLSEIKYRNIVMNADTFMVVVSALQTLGANSVAPPVAITAGDVTTTTSATGPSVTISGAKVAFGADGQPANLAIAIKNVSDPSHEISAEKAQAAADIINDYLNYRLRLGRAMRKAERAAATARSPRALASK